MQLPVVVDVGRIGPDIHSPKQISDQDIARVLLGVLLSTTAQDMDYCRKDARMTSRHQELFSSTCFESRRHSYTCIYIYDNNTEHLSNTQGF